MCSYKNLNWRVDMSIQPPFPDINTCMSYIGETGRRICEVSASEGAAGNISCFYAWDLEYKTVFSNEEIIDLPLEVPNLDGGIIIITGSGRRLREVYNNPAANLAVLKIIDGGKKAILNTSAERLFQKPTSEFNSHLAVHNLCVKPGVDNFHSVVHAQPTFLTYLSHIDRYQEEQYLNRHILRWEPEAICNLNDGVGFLPFAVPGSDELMDGTLESLKTHKIIIWAKHGVIARSNMSVKKACDLIEYAETCAHYEYLNLCNHGVARGLSDKEIKAVADAFDIKQDIFK